MNIRKIVQWLITVIAMSMVIVYFSTSLAVSTLLRKNDEFPRVESKNLLQTYSIYKEFNEICTEENLYQYEPEIKMAFGIDSDIEAVEKATVSQNFEKRLVQGALKVSDRSVLKAT